MAFHQLINLSRLILINIVKVEIGMIDVKTRFMGNVKDVIKKILRKNSKIKKVGVITPQKIPPAFSRKCVPGIFKTSL
jgi:hypothetical protein